MPRKTRRASRAALAAKRIFYMSKKLPFLLQTLPFSINNRYKLSAMFIVFFGSGLSFPFIAVRHQMLKA
jgi:hypothetical protein